MFSVFRATWFRTRRCITLTLCRLQKLMWNLMGLRQSECASQSLMEGSRFLLFAACEKMDTKLNLEKRLTGKTEPSRISNIFLSVLSRVLYIPYKRNKKWPRWESAAAGWWCGLTLALALALLLLLLLLLLLFGQELTSSWTLSKSQRRNSRASCWEFPRNWEPYFATVLWGEERHRNYYTLGDF